MVTHVVFFRFDTLDNAEEAAARLRGLIGVVESLQEVEAGLDFTRSERSWDLCLITRFEDREGLEAYRVHPAHQAVVRFIKEHATETAAVDYESTDG